ncbi:hypothetical protein F5Y12DRAFT_604241 [Xylaria sp. FL1777]|nr:hypothetical protein F5Y12DRAFT_604241 [Xylaria sp. FL1777]
MSTISTNWMVRLRAREFCYQYMTIAMLTYRHVFFHAMSSLRYTHTYTILSFFLAFLLSLIPFLLFPSLPLSLCPPLQRAYSSSSFRVCVNPARETSLALHNSSFMAQPPEVKKGIYRRKEAS